jgi:hypothetical protein
VINKVQIDQIDVNYKLSQEIEIKDIMKIKDLKILSQIKKIIGLKANNLH